MTGVSPPADLRPAAARARGAVKRVRPASPPVRVVPKHHALVRLSHWVNVPLLLGLTASGLAIYWAAPVFLHAPDPVTGSRDYLRDLGIMAARWFPDGGDPRGGSTIA